MATRPLSPAARNRLHDGCLVWAGVLLLVLLTSLDWWVSAPVEHPGGVVWTVLLLSAAAVLVVVGVRGRRAAAAFNRRDDAFADALTHQLDQLRRHGRATSYAAGPGAARLSDARLVLAERHFDQQTVGLATRTSTMGDAVLAVVEAPLPDGGWDTYRVLTPSLAGTYGWLSDVVAGTAHGLGGPATHAGATLLGWRPALVETFRPDDVSYLSDRLTVVAARPPEGREPVQACGAWVGHHALLAASVRVGAQEPLQVMPLGFPALLDRAVAIATEQSEQSERALALESAAPPRTLR